MTQITQLARFPTKMWVENKNIVTRHSRESIRRQNNRPKHVWILVLYWHSLWEICCVERDMRVRNSARKTTSGSRISEWRFASGSIGMRKYWPQPLNNSFFPFDSTKFQKILNNRILYFVKFSTAFIIIFLIHANYFDTRCLCLELTKPNTVSLFFHPHATNETQTNKKVITRTYSPQPLLNVVTYFPFPATFGYSSDLSR